MVGHMTRADGRAMRNLPFVVLIHLIWLFLWPLLAGASFNDVILPTLLSVPPFLYLHLCTYFYGGPHSRRLPYIAGIFLLAFILTPFNLSGMGYLIFGFFTLSFTLRWSLAWRAIALAIVLYTVELFPAGAQHLDHRQRAGAAGHFRHRRRVHRLHHLPAGRPETQQGGNHAARDARRTRAHRPRPA